MIGNVLYKFLNDTDAGIDTFSHNFGQLKYLLCSTKFNLGDVVVIEINECWISLSSHILLYDNIDFIFRLLKKLYSKTTLKSNFSEILLIWIGYFLTLKVNMVLMDYFNCIFMLYLMCCRETSSFIRAN